MKLIIQRVTKASVTIAKKKIANIGKGFLVLIGIENDDTTEKADYLVKKLCNLRVFEDNGHKMNLSIKKVEGELLIVSQFTLCADTTSGNRPSFVKAAKPDKANRLYHYFIQKCKENNIQTQSGVFGKDMKVELINDGPVTIMLEK